MIVKIKTILKWAAITTVLGLSCGVIGYLFFKTLETVTTLRANYNYIVFLLPIGGLLSVLLNNLLKTTNVNTNTIIHTASGGEKITAKILPAIFTSSILTHLFGGSAGREGAALQIGGGTAACLGKAFKLDKDDLSAATVAGMGATFSALFGTPIGACIFALEVAYCKKIFVKAAIPTLASSLLAFFVSVSLGTHPERFEFNHPTYDGIFALRVILISFVVAIVGTLFCFALKFCHNNFKKAIKNDYLLIFIGGVAILLLTLLIGNQDYNGSGNSLIVRIFEEGKVNSYDFLLKLIFTVITVAVGFRGGEIVPSFCIGATLGGYIATTLGVDVTIGAVIGMTAIFNAVTKCPIATIFVCLEMFGINALPLCIVAVIMSMLLSGRTGLYKYKENKFSQLKKITSRI